MSGASRGFIVSPRYDTAFFTASLALPLLLWVGFSFGLLTGVAVYAIFQLAFNLPHNFQTWTMSVLDEEDRSRHGRRYAIALAVCVLVFALPMALSPDGVYPWVRDALIYWGYYHLVRQHYGFQRLYEKKMGGVPALESKLYARFLDAVSYLPLLVRFRDPELMTIHAGKMAAHIWHPVLPRAAWMAVAALYALIVVAAIVHHLVAVARGRTGLLPRALHFAAVTLAFALAGLVIRDLIVAIAVVTAFHNLQYIGLVWFHNANRAADGATDGNPAVRWIATHRIGRYVAVSMLYGVVILLPRALSPGTRLAELPITLVVAMHYYVDARIWRFKDYPRLGRWLRLSAPSASSTAPAPPRPAVASAR
jgi:hypothetical protein